LRYSGAQWDAQIVPFIHAWRRSHASSSRLAKKLRLASVRIEYRHPAAQTAAEEGVAQWGRKRLMQLSLLEPLIEQAFEEVLQT
jgi:hypothetical protein